jgi:hypothetical protein
MKHLVSLSVGLLLCLAAGDALAAPAAETAGQVLAKLAKMTPEQRQKTLVEKPRLKAKFRSIVLSKRSKSIRSSRHFANAIPSLR